jgi:L-arabinose isomerase
LVKITPYTLKEGETPAGIAGRFHLKQGTVISASRIEEEGRYKECAG